MNAVRRPPAAAGVVLLVVLLEDMRGAIAAEVAYRLPRLSRGR